MRYIVAGLGQDSFVTRYILRVPSRKRQKKKHVEEVGLRLREAKKFMQALHLQRCMYVGLLFRDFPDHQCSIMLSALVSWRPLLSTRAFYACLDLSMRLAAQRKRETKEKRPHRAHRASDALFPSAAKTNAPTVPCMNCCRNMYQSSINCSSSHKRKALYIRDTVQ